MQSAVKPCGPCVRIAISCDMHGHHEHDPKLRSLVCEQFVASRGQLRRHPRASYLRAHAMMAGGDGRCVTRRELDWNSLAARRTKWSVPHDAPLHRGKHTSAGAFERLQHVIIGGLGFQDPNLFDYCSVYARQEQRGRQRAMQRARCAKSPCPSVVPTPRAVTPDYASPLFTPAMRAWRAQAEERRATEHWRRVEGAAGQRRSERLSARQQSHNPGIAV